jgi:hypothetical protein
MTAPNAYATRHGALSRRVVLTATCSGILIAVLAPPSAIAAPEGRLKSMSLDLTVPFQVPWRYLPRGQVG